MANLHFSKEHRATTFSGILFVSLFALASMYLAEMNWLTKIGISPLIIAILLGITYGNSLRPHLPTLWVPGVQFSAKNLLRIAIILYGFRVSYQQIAAVGIEGLLIDLFVVIFTLMFGYWMGVKVLKLDRHLTILISSGSAICGAAAVLAVEDVLHSESYKATVAVGTVVLFGTLAMFIWPILQHFNVLNMSENQYGIFVGASVHEVAQALVAGTNVSVSAGNTAVIVKMTRVLLLVPSLILLSLNQRRFLKIEKNQKINFKFPWFALLFVVMIGINSLHILPETVIQWINECDIFFLTMAMAAIGMETSLQKIKEVGLYPLYLASALFLWLFFSVYILIHIAALSQ